MLTFTDGSVVSADKITKNDFVSGYFTRLCLVKLIFRTFKIEKRISS